MRTITMMIFSLVLLVAASCAPDDELPPPPADPCTTINEYRCNGEIVERCSFDAETGVKSWDGSQDCSGSETPNCQCVVFDGILGGCSVGGDPNSATATPCQGQFL